MSRSTTRVCRALAVLVLLAALGPAAPARERAVGGERARARAEDPLPRCCFTNPRYSGTCEVVPAKDESCGQILDYLNNPMSQGKSYCGSTPVRGGWQNVACEPPR